MVRGSMLALALCLLTAGCGSDVETEIVGEWKGMTVGQDLAFHADGRIEMKGHRHGVYEGRYVIADGNKLTCEFARLSEPVISTASIRGDKLTLSLAGGRKEQYVRK